jgi:hypothetical protein
LHVAACPRSPLANGIWDTACLANANPDLSIVVANHNYGAKPKPPATFEYLGHAGNVYNAFIQFISIIKGSSFHCASLEF